MISNNKRKTTPSAFSLIELSIVSIIIGLIISGIVIGHKMIYLSRLTSARTLTNSSPIKAMYDIELWLETTTINSFLSTERIDGATITTWYDINPQLTKKHNATGSGNAAYDKDGLNKLPAIVFDRTDDFFTVDFTMDKSRDLTIFVVAQFDDIGGTSTLISQQAGTGNGETFLRRYSTFSFAINSFLGGGHTNGAVVPAETSEIFVLTQNSNNLTIYQNGIQTGQSTRHATFADGNWLIGTDETGNLDMSGHIGEIIVFDRIISTIEREKIEEYLSKKWHIPLD